MNAIFLLTDTSLCFFVTTTTIFIRVVLKNGPAIVFYLVCFLQMSTVQKNKCNGNSDNAVEIFNIIHFSATNCKKNILGML